MKRMMNYIITVSLRLLCQEVMCNALSQPVFITTTSEHLSPLVHAVSNSKYQYCKQSEYGLCIIGRGVLDSFCLPWSFVRPLVLP